MRWHYFRVFRPSPRSLWVLGMAEKKEETSDTFGRFIAVR